MEVRKTLTLNKPLSEKTLSKIKIKKTSEDIKKKIADDKHKKKQRITNTLQWLCERYPACFNLTIRKPLKLKIENDVFKDLESISNHQDLPSKKSLRDAISYYVNNTNYLNSCLNQTHRIDLQGTPLSDDPVTDEHMDYVKNRIEYVNSKKLASKSKKIRSKNNKPK